jgi:hypothetical protein
MVMLHGNKIGLLKNRHGCYVVYETAVGECVKTYNEPIERRRQTKQEIENKSKQLGLMDHKLRMAMEKRSLWE